MEGPDNLLACGNKAILRDKNAGALAWLEKFIQFYQPAVLVLPDVQAKDTRRAKRIKTLHKQMVAWAVKREVKVRLVSNTQVRLQLLNDAKATKQAVADVLVKRFPTELATRLPPKRRPWMTLLRTRFAGDGRNDLPDMRRGGSGRRSAIRQPRGVHELALAPLQRPGVIAITAFRVEQSSFRRGEENCGFHPDVAQREVRAAGGVGKQTMQHARVLAQFGERRGKRGSAYHPAGGGNAHALYTVHHPQGVPSRSFGKVP